MWNKPKKTLRRISLTLAIISLAGMIFWLLAWYIWINKPEYIQSLDEKIPNYYEQSIQSHKEKIRNSKSKNEQIDNIIEFINEFDGTTSLNKVYGFMVEMYELLIKNQIETNQFDKAIATAEKWEQKYPYEFRAKFAYFNLLKQTDSEKSLEYISNIYNKYPDINEISNLYAHALLENGRVSDSINIGKLQKESSIDNSEIGFMFFYKNDKYPSFHADTKITLPLKNVERVGNQYSVIMQKEINKIKGLRIDIDGMRVGSKISDIKIDLTVGGRKYENLEFKPLNQIVEAAHGFFKPIGTDPYFEIFIPEEFKGQDILADIKATLTIQNQPEFFLENMLDSEEWQFFYSENKDFSEDKSIKFKVDTTIHDIRVKVEAKLALQPLSAEFVRLDFPAVSGLKFTNFKIELDDVVIETDKYVAANNLNYLQEESTINVTGNDPHIIFKLNTLTSIKSVNVYMELGE